jgi:hypothetical protein
MHVDSAELEREHEPRQRPISQTNALGIPQHTGFYASFFDTFCNPFALRITEPYIWQDCENSRDAPNDAQELEEEGLEDAAASGLAQAEEPHDDPLAEWVMVEDDLHSDWVSVRRKRA